MLPYRSLVDKSSQDDFLVDQKLVVSNELGLILSCTMAFLDWQYVQKLLEILEARLGNIGNEEDGHDCLFYAFGKADCILFVSND